MQLPVLKPNCRNRARVNARVRLMKAGFLIASFLCVSGTLMAQSAEYAPVARMLELSTPAVGTRARSVIPADRSSDTVEASVIAPSLNQASAIERDAFERINVARQAHGLEPLAWHAELCQMARMHSESMAVRDFFDHETPEGLKTRERARALGVRFRVIGENIAYNKGYDAPGAFAVERWMNSPGHRANILYIGFEYSAIGVYVSSDGSVYLTQVLISR